jgi:xylan 1,4-beta-xylosidase
VTGLPAAAYRMTHWRVDATHSNVAALWRAIGAGRDWPDERQWAVLRDADRLQEVERPRVLPVEGGAAAVAFDLPMPSISCVELVPI